MLELLRRLRLRARGVRVSRSARVCAGVRVDRARGASVTVHPGAVLGEGARISALGGSVVIGPGARLRERSIVTARSSVTIGSRVVVGDWATVTDEAQPGLGERGPVLVGDGAVIGPHAVVGVSIAPGTEIAPYAVV